MDSDDAATDKKAPKERELVRTTVDFTAKLWEEIAEVAAITNVPKASVIKIATFEYVQRHLNKDGGK